MGKRSDHDEDEHTENIPLAPETSSVTAPEEVTIPVTSSGSPVLGDDVGALMGDGPQMPEVQEGAIAAAKEASQPASSGESTGSPVKGKTDDKGRPFDPKLHEVDAAGRPKLNRDGWLAKRRGGAGKATTAPLRSKVNPGGAGKVSDVCGPTQQAEEFEVKVAQSSTACAGLFIMSAQVVGGPEFQPESGEPEFLRDSFATYFRAKGIVDIPPGVGLAIAMGGYIAKRWSQPVFAQKRKGWWAWVKSYLDKRREKASADAAMAVDPA